MKPNILILLLLSNSLFGQTNNLDTYKRTLDTIQKTEEFKKFTDTKTDRIQVMPEVIPFALIGFGFKEDIKIATGNDYNDLTANKSIELNPKIIELSERKRSKLKLYFSPVENGIVFVELVYSSRKGFYYEGVTNFGETLVFYLQYKNNDLIELKTSHVHHN
jgi:hypothetical protein